MNTILIAGENPRDATALSTRLRAEGIEISTSGNGTDALTRAIRIKPDLILLDAVLPGLDGYEVCAKLKENPETAEIPVVFLTALHDETRCFALGAADYIPKPYDLDIVVHRITKQLQTGNALRERDAEIRKLQDTVAKRTAELAALRRRMELINDSKDLMIKLIVRELSAPATGIAGIARIALTGEQDAEKRERLNELLARNMATMDRLIANVEYLGTLKSSATLKRNRPVAIIPMLEAILEAESPRFAERSLEIARVFPGETVVAPVHPELFTQIFSPAVKLAATLALPGTVVEVCLEWAPDSASISVTWAGELSNHGLVASATDLGADILREIGAAALMTELCLAEKIARICNGTVVWDLRDREASSFAVQFDLPKPAPQAGNPAPRD